jgi:hypothetical protein
MGLDSSDFVAELAAKGADVGLELRRSSDLIFYGAKTRADLGRLAALKEALAPAGALWIVRPKGSEAIGEADVLGAGRAAGLVDVKVVKFSETQSAAKFVIPLSKRK